MRGWGGGGGEGEVPNVTVLSRLGWVSVVKQSSYPKPLAAAAKAGGRYQHLSCKTAKQHLWMLWLVEASRPGAQRGTQRAFSSEAQGEEGKVLGSVTQGRSING